MEDFAKYSVKKKKKRKSVDFRMFLAGRYGCIKTCFCLAVYRIILFVLYCFLVKQTPLSTAAF